MRPALVLTFVLAAAAPATAQVKTQLQGGPLTLENGTGIVVQDEMVTISKELVTATYQFRNTTHRDVETVVSFLLRIPANSDGSAESEENPPPKDWQPSTYWTPEATGFHPMVDGKPRETKTLWREVGEVLEVRHFWQQQFPAGATVSVEHQYFPGGGTFAPGGPDDEQWHELARNYCVGPKLVGAANDALMTYVTHRLKASPAAPIGRLRVILKKTKPNQRVSLCLDGFEKRSPTTFELERKNFTLDLDLRLIFLDLASRSDGRANLAH
jgi:hypothetical protein